MRLKHRAWVWAGGWLLGAIVVDSLFEREGLFSAHSAAFLLWTAFAMAGGHHWLKCPECGRSALWPPRGRPIEESIGNNCLWCGTEF